MGLKWANFARAKLATPPSGGGGLSFTVEAGKGALFPSLSAGDYFYAVLKNAAKTVSEVVKVEARSTDAFTIATGGRGLDGTSGETWTANDYVELCATRIAMLEVFNAAVVAIGAVTPAADKMVYFTSATAASVLDFPSWARSVVSAASTTAGANALLNTVSGNLGLGTASPSYTLHIAKASGSADLRVINAGGTGSDLSTVLSQAGSTLVQATAYGSGEGYFTGSAATSLNYGNAANGPVLFIQNNITRGRIDANGYLLWGYTASNGAYPLQVNGQIFATNSTVATSDGRYKEQVKSISGSLGVVDQLRPVSFRWKPHPVHNFDTETEQLGFIAQEVEQALSGRAFRGGVVKTGRAKIDPGKKDREGKVVAEGLDEEFIGIAEGKLIPLLVGAIQELKAIVDAQAQRITALEGGK